MESLTSKKRDVNHIYISSAIVSVCGIVYQVLYGAAGGYIFGDGVLFYCITIGLFLMGMGFGANNSERMKKNLLNRFIQIEYLIAFVGGFSTLGLFFMLSHFGSETAQIYLYIVITLTGFLTGIELPILIRKARDIGETIERSTARVLFSDYAGSLVGSIGFALVLRPWLGLIQTAFFIAIINILISLWITFRFQKEISKPTLHKVIGILLSLVLFFGFLFGEQLMDKLEKNLYQDPIIYSTDTQYQRIVITKTSNDVRLFLNGQLQFSEFDEKRYHESLVHIPLSLSEKKENILVLGGGDGLVARELLKYPEVKHIDLVDLDPKMTHLAQTHHELLRLNKGSLNNEKVDVHNQDAFNFLMNNEKLYDSIIVDLPDPNNAGLNKLYTEGFYKLVRNHLKPGGFVSIQSTSPLFATKAYWTISKTVEASGLNVDNYHVDVPSFGNWGFTLASRDNFSMEDIKNIELEVDTHYLSEEMIPSLFYFGKDTDNHIVDDNNDVFEIPVNTMNRPDLVQLYNQAWKYY